MYINSLTLYLRSIWFLPLLNFNQVNIFFTINFFLILTIFKCLQLYIYEKVVALFLLKNYLLPFWAVHRFPKPQITLISLYLKKKKKKKKKKKSLWNLFSSWHFFHTLF